MRRRPDSVNGVMEFLFVSLIRHFRASGFDGMNLGLAPLAGVDGEGVTSRVLCAVRDHAGSFNFDGLRAFKEKWRPRWEARYIAYERDLDLPRIAVGITRVGELEPRRPERRVFMVAKQYPFSLAMIGLTLWISVTTNLDPRFEPCTPRQARVLVSHAGTPRGGGSSLGRPSRRVRALPG